METSACAFFTVLLKGMLTLQIASCEMSSCFFHRNKCSQLKPFFSISYHTALSPIITCSLLHRLLEQLILQNTFDHTIIFIMLGQERERANSWGYFLRTEVTEHCLATTKQYACTFYSK